MIKNLKKLIQRYGTKTRGLEPDIIPCPLFEEKFLDEFIYISKYSAESGSTIFRTSNTDVVISPLDGLLIVNKEDHSISIDHGHFYINGKITRVMTEYKNIDLLLAHNTSKKLELNKLLGCIAVKAGDEIGLMGDGNLEFTLYFDFLSIDPEPFIELSFK